MFSAAQLAAALGKTPQAIRKQLRAVRPTSVRIIGGNETAVWSLSKLPGALTERLQEAARKGQFFTKDARRAPDVEALLNAPAKIWEPSLPLSQIADADVDSALKLREALKPWLIDQHKLTLSTAELETRGVADYQKNFGHRITGRYWRELFMRTLRRDNGAENWDRLEIYLSEKPTAKQTPARIVAEAVQKEFAELDSFIAACGNPTDPSDAEQRAIWTLAFDRYVRFVREGMSAKKAARKTRLYLFAKAPFLASSRDALLKAFNRKLAALESSNGDVKVLLDRRQENGERYQLPEDDRDALIHRSVFYYRGDVAPAWRDLLRSGFSQPVRERYVGRAACKSHVPTSVMDSVRPEVDIMTVMYQGARAFDSIKGFVERNYEGLASLRCFVADDFTMPVYFYVPDGKGWFNLTRGQILVFIDFRTHRIVGWSMQPDRNYSSLTIRSLCTHVFGEFGVPDVLYFENGIWRSSTLLKGRDPAPFEFTEVVQGLREFGIKFVHAIRPRSKTVERIGGLLQDRMESEPGYCGRNERIDAPESLRQQIYDVQHEKIHPEKHFYSYEQWNQRFGEIVLEYNAASQQGKVLCGLCPDEALVKFADLNNPPIQFGPSLRFLLAHDKRVLPVTLNGVTFSVGKKKFNYRGEALAQFVGREALVWFDPENPESVIVTDMNKKSPVCVQRSQEPDAMECLTNPDSEILADELKRVEEQASYMKARFHAVKSKFPLPQRKHLENAQHTQLVTLGHRIGLKKDQVTEAKQERASRLDANRRKARSLNIPSILADGDPDSSRALDLMRSAARQASGADQKEEPSK